MGWFGKATSAATAMEGAAKGIKALAPGPVDLIGGAPDASLARSSGVAAAVLAAKRTKKRAAAGSTLLTGQPIGAGINPPAVLAPKSLVGY